MDRSDKPAVAGAVAWGSTPHATKRRADARAAAAGRRGGGGPFPEHDAVVGGAWSVGGLGGWAWDGWGAGAGLVGDRAGGSWDGGIS